MATTSRPGRRFSQLRLLGSGTRAPGFEDGIRSVSFGYYLNATALPTQAQPDGKPPLGGLRVPARRRLSVGVVARFLTDGSLDPSFGDGGLARLQFNATEQPEYVYAIALDPAGRILFVHSCCGPSLGRLTSDGDLDPSFGSGGRVQFSACAAPGGVVTLDSRSRRRRTAARWRLERPPTVARSCASTRASARSALG